MKILYNQVEYCRSYKLLSIVVLAQNLQLSNAKLQPVFGIGLVIHEDHKDI